MKTIGALEEIGAQVGDVVECQKGWRVTVRDVTKKGSQHIVYVKEHSGWYDGSNADWRIVTKAAKSPVRTVTRKEIVPGIYGKVSVHETHPDNGGYYIAMVDSLTHKMNTIHSAMTLADLTAAIATLTEIRDAMQDNT